MRIGFRALTVVSASLLMAMACVGGENQCLNPQPDLPSCNANGRPVTGFGGAGNNDDGNGNGNGASAGAPAIIVGGGSSNPGDLPEQPVPGAAAGDGGSGGAGGDTAFVPTDEAGAAGSAGASGADGH